jgi:hypothetical protein
MDSWLGSGHRDSAGSRAGTVAVEPVSAMSGFGPAMIRAATIIPAALIVLFLGLLWLVGLACGDQRRTYVIVITDHAMRALHSLLAGYPTMRMCAGCCKGVPADRGPDTSATDGFHDLEGAAE